MRILVGKDWYEPLASHTLLETEYESLVSQAASHLFPRFTWIDLKIQVESPHGLAKPDFVLVHETYGDWWVGEAELAHHPLGQHVLPQVQKLSTGNYDELFAEKVLAAASHLDKGKLVRMMKGAPPRVLVIVNQAAPDWEVALAPWGAHIATVEVYRSEKARHLLSVSGDLPRVEGSVISTCRVDPYLRGMLAVDSPAALPGRDGDVIAINIGQRVADWTILEIADSVWLKPRGTAPGFDPSRKIQLCATDDGQLEFRQPARGK